MVVRGADVNNRGPQCLFTCDGCGRQAPGYANRHGHWFKPHEWYQRTDQDGTQLACSRACIETVAVQTGKTPAVLPA
jgi:hypothetical protein